MSSSDEPPHESERMRDVGVDRRPAITRVLVLVPQIKARRRDEGSDPLRDPLSRLDEACGLALAIDLDIVGKSVVPINVVRPATLFGSGKVDELHDWCTSSEADIVIVDGALTPVQQRNLERAWNVKVLDRTALILEIFGDRARTKEGVLQVELAHLTYQKSRLVRSWTHLERQRGGVGFLGGPGETQIEADRREIQNKINRLENALKDVRRTRDLHRKKRKKVPHPVIALVGYTNAGKSTLFNRMTNSEIFAKDLLFATLDPTLRRIDLPHGATVILSDTVGFISDLPTQLIAAFQATLEEVIEADLILHVRDIAHPDTELQAADVNTTLSDLGVEPGDGARIVEVLNKIDLLPEATDLSSASATTERIDRANAVPVSALTGEGVDDLLQRIETALHAKRKTYAVCVPLEEGAALAKLYEDVEVLSRIDTDEGIALTVRVPNERLTRFLDNYGDMLRDSEWPEQPQSD